tara:strand:- start:8533 stop:8784 length:252 start_codon:yes stop_codon:yes gene_type:complete
MKIYTQTNCSHCDKLKNKLQELKIPFIDIDINDEINKDECEGLFKLTGEPVVPIIVKPPHVLAPNRSFTTIDQAVVLIQSLID